MIESRILLLINQSGESLERLVTRRGFRVRIRQAAVSEYWRVDVADDPSAFLHPLRESPVLALADALGIRVKGAKAVPGVPGHEHRVAGDGIGLLHAPASCVNQPLVRLVIRMPLASEQMSTGTTGDLDHVGQPVFEHWLANMIEIASCPGAHLLGGQRHPYHKPNQRLVYATGRCVEETDAVAGYSMFMSWDTWDRFGPFDANAKGIGQSEDWAFSQRVKKGGGIVGYIRPPVLAHCGLTNTDSKPATGHEAFERFPGLIYE